MVHLWALLVGIDVYRAHSITTLQGCVKDVKNTHQYLQEDLHVPCYHIVILTNEAATKHGIISAFRSHLIDNHDIERGDTILFHFSGHASSLNTDSGSELVLIPHDESLPSNDSPPICGISGRTLGSLFNEIATTRSDNITFILDACHAFLGGRGDMGGSPNLLTRGIDSSRITPIWDNDPEFLRDDGGENTYQGVECAFEGENAVFGPRDILTKQADRSLVMLAACDGHEQASDTADGGLFTIYWIRALRNMNICPRTYAEIIKHVTVNIRNFLRPNELRSAKRPLAIGMKSYRQQTPQCMARNPHRIVFEDVILNPKYFHVQPQDSKNLFRVAAGEVHGITADTSFELHEMTPDLQSNRIVGIATAKHIFPTYCDAVAEPINNMDLGAIKVPHLTALISKPRYHLKYSIENTDPDSEKTRDIVSCIEKSIDEADPVMSTNWERVEPDIDCDDRDRVFLEVDDDEGGGVSLRTISALESACRLNIHQVRTASFPDILHSIARFIFYLAHENSSHPFVDVHFAMHVIEPPVVSDVPDDFAAWTLKEEMSFDMSGEATVQCSGHEYAIVLLNHTSTDLHPHIVSFNTETYRIETCYTSQHKTPMLQHHSTLQIGASPTYSDSFYFSLDEGESTATSFLKVYLTQTDVNMEFIDQPSVFTDHPGERSATNEDSECLHAWDSITRKFIVTSFLPEEDV